MPIDESGELESRLTSSRLKLGQDGGRVITKDHVCKGLAVRKEISELDFFEEIAQSSRWRDRRRA
jgi:hypothetical protein